jgi:hypothetical protein
MKLTNSELEFLSAWAREEWETACYQLPAHQLQLSHGVSGASLILFIKAWTKAEGKKDQEILNIRAAMKPEWPWSTSEEFQNRLHDANTRASQPENSPALMSNYANGTKL